MKLIKHLLAAVLVTCAGIAAADTVEFVHYYPPGGGVDQHTIPLIKYLENSGHRVTKKFFKTCSEAVTYSVNADHIVYFVEYQDELQSGDGTCPVISLLPKKLSFVSPVTSASFYLCTAPGKAHLTIDHLRRDRSFVGTSAFDTETKQQILSFIRNTNVGVIPYSGSAGLRTALISGDLDYFYGSSVASAMMALGSKCLLSGSRVNALNLPYIGSVFPGYNTEAVNKVSVWTNRSAPNNIKQITAAFKSAEFGTFLSQQPLLTHTGLGSGRTLDQLQAEKSKMAMPLKK
jgi:hypothetical protein